MNEHSSKQFDAELDSIRANVTRMGGLAEEQVRAALTAFIEGDHDLIETIVARDEGVDAMEVTIDDACMHIVARRQPTAIDLRMVMSVSKAVTDLERIGDEAKKIAKTTRKILERGVCESIGRTVGIQQVGEQVAAMLHDVLDAFVRLDVETAARIVREDKEIDQHFRSIMRQLVTYMMEDPRTISTALDIIFIGRSVERIGDHCKNIAKDVIYIAQGRDVRHIGLEALERDIREGAGE
jgi:phosphate transport system protein